MGVPSDCIEVQPISAGAVIGEDNLFQNLIFSRDCSGLFFLSFIIEPLSSN